MEEMAALDLQFTLGHRLVKDYELCELRNLKL